MTGTLPEAVAVIAPIPGHEHHGKGALITDAETIKAIYDGALQRSVVPVHRDYAMAHAARTED